MTSWFRKWEKQSTVDYIEEWVKERGETFFSCHSIVEKFEFTYAVVMVEWSKKNDKSGISWVSPALWSLNFGWKTICQPSLNYNSGYLLVYRTWTRWHTRVPEFHRVWGHYYASSMCYWFNQHSSEDLHLCHKCTGMTCRQWLVGINACLYSTG